MGTPRFRILGPLEIAGTPVPAGPKQRALLTRLLLRANEHLARERLIDELWPERPPATAAHAIHVYVSQLRKVLPPDALIVGRGGGYRLEVDEDDVDALRFERLAEHGRRLLRDGNPHGAATVLREADELWRGPLDAPPDDPEAARLEELRVGALEERLEADLQTGADAELVPELESLVRQHPLRERLWRQLMLALYRSGRQADALAAFREAHRTFDRELGIEPGPQLRELQRAVLQQDPSLVAAPARLRRLPAPTAPLIGRRREVDELRALLTGEARLITLTGTGGVGKTRIALELAHALADAFADGVAFVELAPLPDASLVLSEIARSVGAEGTAALAHRLHDSELLLVLDNLEHLDAAAPDVARLLEAPGLRLLVTSRRPLNVYAEHEYRLRPLGDDDAAALFLARARAVQRDVIDAPEIREVCARLDRLPLAIELVAVRARDFSPRELLDLVRTRLAAASAATRDLPERHRTLRATVEWSYSLLDWAERSAFARLAVFAGAFSPAAAHAVCGVDRDGLASLAAQSLIVRQDERYGFLETIREYALERLDADPGAEETRRAHADYFLSLVAEGSALRMTEAEVGWMDRLELERDDLREALRWLARNDAPAAARLVVGAFRFWYTRGHFDEAARAYAEVREQSEALDADARPELLTYSAAFAFGQRHFDRALELAEESLALHRDRGDDVATARSLVLLGTVHGERGESEKALALLEESVTLARTTGDRRALSFATAHLALAALGARDFERAEEVAAESIPLLQEVGDRLGEASAHANAAFAALMLDRPSDAVTRFATALDLARRFGDPAAVIVAVEGIAAVAARHGEFGAAARLLGASAAATASGELTLEALSRSLREETLELLRGTSGPEAVDRGLAAGAALSLDDATDHASTIANTLLAAAEITSSARRGRRAGRKRG